MSSLQFTPEMIRLAEILQFQGAPGAVGPMLDAFQQAARWAQVLSDHPNESVRRAAIARGERYLRAIADIQRLFEELEADLTQLREEETRTPAPAETGLVGAVVAPLDVPPGSRAGVLRALAAEHGRERVVLVCPSCVTGLHVAADGICGACRRPAIDTNAPGVVPWFCEDCARPFEAVSPASTDTNQDVACPRCHGVETFEGHAPIAGRAGAGVVVRIEKRSRT